MKISLFVSLIFFIVTCFQLKAQEVMQQEIQIDGVIINKEDNKPVPFVHVINIRNKTGTASNLQGRFSIIIKYSDTLVFSAIGFDKYIFNLSERVETKQLDITIEMNTNSFELAPVSVFAYKDEMAFKQAILDLEVNNENNQARIQLPGVHYGVKSEVSPSILNPLSYFYYKTSKRAKEERKYKLLEKEYEGWKNIAEKYNPMIVQEVTGLQEDIVEDFMNFCKLDNKYIEISTQYEIVIAINNCLKDYKKQSENNQKIEN